MIGTRAVDVVIGYTPASEGYDPRVDGFRPGQPVGLRVAFTIATDASAGEIADAVVAQTNPKLRRPYVAGLLGQVFSAIPTAPPVGVGDTVTVAGNLMACELVGWSSPALHTMEEDQ